MQRYWLQKNNRKTCIIFFAGWSMDHHPFLSIPSGQHDVCIFYNYRHVQDVSLQGDQDFAQYEKIHLLAWSMGVSVAGQLFKSQHDIFASSTAIGGTLRPIDNRLGIPVDSYCGLINDWSQEALRAFHHSMFEQDEHVARFEKFRPQRSLEGCHLELQALHTFFAQSPALDKVSQSFFTHTIITSRDRVFPARNQRRAWPKETSMSKGWPHFPFYHLSDFQELLPAS